MDSVLNYLLDLFSSVFGFMKSISFTAFGYTVSYFWLLVSLTFMGFLFSALLPFASRSADQYQKSTSERNDKSKSNSSGGNSKSKSSGGKS
jgi:hypothetical protein